MAAIHGRLGHISGSTIKPLSITGFTVVKSTDAYETTELLATAPTHETWAADGLLDISGTITCQLSDSTTNPPQQVNDLEVGVVFKFDAGNTWTFDALITTASVTTDRNDVSTIVYDYKGNSAIVEVWS